jgi:hypothetical protein
MERTNRMTMRDKIAAVMWRTQAVDVGAPESVPKARTPEAFSDEADSTRATWLKQADAIIAALPGMVVPLVWEKSHTMPWDDDYHSLPTAYTIRCADENGWKWSYNGGHGYERGPEAAKAAANAHHRAAVCKAMGLAP